MSTKAERAAIEAERGVVRNEQGEIVHTPEWIKARIARLNFKLEEYKTRTANAKAEIKQLEKELE